ncbi:MAG: uroporphyrinogen-III synthase [Acidiferrobacterales bacterium]|nr:uroporphyrinogen-III synthase [Acidiferrobacterales bacterium]
MPGRRIDSGTCRSLEGVSVLVTRPSAYAGYLIGEIELRGGHAIALPTVQVEYTVEASGLPAVLCADSERKLAIFTSRNAVDAVAEWLRDSNAAWPRVLECAAVGRKTAQAIENSFGIDCAIYPESAHGITHLMEMDRMQNLARTPSMVIDGGGANSKKLSDLLRHRGSPSVAHFVVYRRKCPDVDIGPVAEYLGQGSIGYVVITSVSGATNLFSILGTQLSDRLRASCMITYSERIADRICSEGFDQVVVASESCDDAVIAAIENSVQAQDMNIASGL